MCSKATVVRSGSSPRYVALLFILLVAGGECGRMSEQAAVLSVAHDHLRTSEQLLSRKSYKGPLVWWHNDVCRSREINSDDPSLAVKRYVQKYKRLEAVTHKLNSDKCSKGCAFTWIELQSRLTHFSSCSAVSQRNENMHTQTLTVSTLVRQMRSKETPLRKIFADALAAVGSRIHRSSLFPAGDKCSFYPSRLDATEALKGKDPDEVGRLLRAQLFGEECDEAAAQEYLDSLTSVAKSTASATMAVVDRVVELARRIALTHEDDQAEIKREVVDAAKDTKAIVKDVNLQNKNAINGKVVAREVDNQKVEERVEIKQEIEEASTSDTSALVEAVNYPEDGGEYAEDGGEYDPFWDNPLSWWEFLVGLIVITVVQALIGTFAGPHIRALQTAYYEADYFGSR